MRNTILFLTFFPMILFAQEIRVKPSNTAEDLPFKIEMKNVTETGRAIEPDAHPESQASFDKLNLSDIYGNKVKPVLDRVTVIEYWTEKSHGENLFWNRMREFEEKYKDNPEVQFISLNYDTVKTGKYQRAAMQKFVKKNTPPFLLYLDKDGGFRETFYVPGPVSYLLIDHRGQYIFAGRGDDPSTSVLFDKHIENCLKYQLYNKQGVTVENKGPAKEENKK